VFHPRVTLRDAGKFWLPVLLWMALIFAASADLGSTQHTSRIIGPFLRFFKPDISPEAIHNVQVAVRKAGHLTGYAILGILLLRARQRAFFANGWNSKSARFAETVATLYAITDELHQSTVPSRMGSAWDVLIDAIGAAIGIAAIWAFGKYRRKW
jgi:VanZ family protein